jgi:hypothetical protein
VIVVDPENPATSTLYTDAEITSALGFNSAAIAGGRVWASHSEAGIVAWEISEPRTPSLMIRPPTVVAPRNLLALDDRRIIFSSGERPFTIDATGTMHSIDDEPHSAAILAIVADGPDHVIAVYEDARVCRRERRELGVTCETRRPARLTAAGTLPWLDDSIRLLLATDAGPIDCIGLDDQLVTQYLCAHRGLRAVAASHALVAAVSPDRQRLVLWNAWDGRKPVTEIHITGLTRHRVADVAIG